MPNQVCHFIHDLSFPDLPPEVVEQARRCLVDLVGVAATGSTTELSRIVRDYAAHNLGGNHRPTRLWFDGRVVSPAGAALAHASTIDAMDSHDGHRLTKGHAGVALLPAAIATLEPTANATLGDVLTALVVGYEIATRAGIELHATAADYHSSGAWNAIGAAAIAARGLGLDHGATEHALGIAEYHAPRAPMMRCIEHPTMIKDSSGWGAHTGVASALLAAGGFTGAPAELLTSSSGSLWQDLGANWLIMEQYFKSHPVCRWAHPAIDAMLHLVHQHAVAPEDIGHIEVTTFAPATTLVITTPQTTEEAQYSLPFPVATAAVHQTVTPHHVGHPELANNHVRRLAESMRVHESPAMTAVTPLRHEADVTLVMHDGRHLSSGPMIAIGDPENLLSTDALVAKFHADTQPVLGPDRSKRLFTRLEADADSPLVELLDEMCPPLP